MSENRLGDSSVMPHAKDNESPDFEVVSVKHP